MNTLRRPKRPSNFPVGKVELASPTTAMAIGSVAIPAVGAIAMPMMPAINTTMDVPDIISE
jgi:hypothetical protein